MSAGLMLLHAWWGLNDDVKKRAESLRREGYTVATPDLFGGKVVSTIEEAKSLSGGEARDRHAVGRRRHIREPELMAQSDR